MRTIPLGDIMTAATLDKPVLVLNKNWTPIHVTTVEEALISLFKGQSSVVEPSDYQTFSWKDWADLEPKDGDAFIQTTSLRVRVPEVIVLTSYDRLPATAVTFSRRNIFKRDHWVCQYCRKQLHESDATIDHVVPRAQGGISSWENCVLACITCNKKKADRSLKDSGMKLKAVPKKPAWTPFYATRTVKLDSWCKFISELYWNIELQK